MINRTERKTKTKGKAKREMMWDTTFNPNLWKFGYEPLSNFKFFES
jgi:hypothetical protein